jgi:aspartate-semialdehyde dehydrogenase
MDIAILGATGLVGELMIKILEERHFPVKQLLPFASKESKSKRIKFKGKDYQVIPLEEKNISRVDLVLSAVENKIALEFIPKFLKHGAIAIDNSSAYRLYPEVPLIVPEVNSHKISSHSGIIANPNCSTVQLVVSLKPLLDKFGLKEVVVTTLQSVSGAGKKGIEALTSEEKGGKALHSPFSSQIHRNLIPHIGEFIQGYTKEEWKIIKETQKILETPELNIIATCIRVPVYIGHSEVITVKLKTKAKLQEIKAVFQGAPGIIYLDQGYTLPIQVEHRDEVFISRLKKHPYLDEVFMFWNVANNLRKGASTNAVQIAELVKK